MAQPTITLVNLTAGDIALEQLAITVPASDSFVVSNFDTAGEVLNDDELQVEFDAGNLRVDITGGGLSSADTTKTLEQSKSLIKPIHDLDVKCNLAGTTAPVATDDEDSGYSVGSIWIDTTGDAAYICVDATSTAAVWEPTGPVSLQAAYDGGNTIVTAGGNALDVSGPESISLDSTSASNFTVVGAALTLSTTGTANTTVSAEDFVVVGSSADEATPLFAAGVLVTTEGTSEKITGAGFDGLTSGNESALITISTGNTSGGADTGPVTLTSGVAAVAGGDPSADTGAVTVGSGAISGGGTSGAVTVTSGGGTPFGSSSTGEVLFRSGLAGGGSSGNATFTSGPGGGGSGNTIYGSGTTAGPSGTGGSGFVLMESGSTSATVASGNVTIGSGNTSGAADSGDVSVGSGNATDTGGASGAVTMSTGSGVTTSGDASGDITIGSGAASSTASSGDVTVTTGASSTTASTENSGFVRIRTGDATTGPNSPAGNIVINPGDSIVTSGEADFTGGNVLITGGSNDSTGSSGLVDIRGGRNDGSGAAGDVWITGGQADGGTGAAGDIELVGGIGLTASDHGSIFLRTPPGGGTVTEATSIVSLHCDGTGTGAGDLINEFVINKDPTTTGGIEANVGSVAFRNSGGTDTTGELWVKTGPNDIDWEQLISTGAVSLQSAYEGGSTIVTSASEGIFSVTGTETITMLSTGANASFSGLNASITSGNAAAAGDVTLTGGTSSGPTNPGGDIFLNAGDGNTTGTGGTVTANAGAGGATGSGGTVSLTGGAGGGTSGDGGAVSMTGGTPTDGAGGAASLIGAAGVGTNRAGGIATIDGGDSTGTANGAAVNITGGDGSTSSIGGAVNIDGGAGRTGGAVNITSGAPDGALEAGDVRITGAKSGGVAGKIFLITESDDSFVAPVTIDTQSGFAGQGENKRTYGQSEAIDASTFNQAVVDLGSLTSNGDQVSVVVRLTAVDVTTKADVLSYRFDGSFYRDSGTITALPPHINSNVGTGAFVGGVTFAVAISGSTIQLELSNTDGSAYTLLISATFITQHGGAAS